MPEGEATIEVGGRQRTYRLRLPQGYSKDKAWPLVLALHPNGGSGIGYWDGEGGARPLRQIVRDKAILVLPLALPRGGGFDWRDNLPTELAYFEALMNRLDTNLCIDKSRIFSMGFSGGGSFSGVLGCHRRDIRAIAVGGAVAYFDAGDCVGTPTAWVNISSGDQSAGRGAFRDFWRSRNQCMATSAPTAPTGCVAYTCPPGKPVHYCTQQGGHAWPGYGTEAAWAFFSQF